MSDRLFYGAVLCLVALCYALGMYLDDNKCSSGQQLSLTEIGYRCK